MGPSGVVFIFLLYCNFLSFFLLYFSSYDTPSLNRALPVSDGDVKKKIKNNAAMKMILHHSSNFSEKIKKIHYGIFEGAI